MANFSDIVVPGMKNAIVITSCTTSAASIAFCLSAIVLVVCLKLHHKLVYRLALYQVVSAMVFGVLWIVYMSLREETSSVILFNVSRILLDCTGLTKIIFTMWIAVHLFALAVFNKNLKRLEILYVAISVLFPLAMALLMLTTAYTTIFRNPSLAKPTAIEEIIVIAVCVACFIITSCLVAILVVILCCRAYRKKVGIPSELDQQHRIALYEMMPIMLFPILFLILAIPVFLYILCANLNIDSDSLTAVSVSYVILAPMWGITAALTLVVHVLVVLYIRKHKNRAKYNERVPQIATNDTEANRTAKESSHFFVPSSTYCSIHVED